MPEAYGYIRVSHDEQNESGLSLEAQEQQCRRLLGAGPQGQRT